MTPGLLAALLILAATGVAAIGAGLALEAWAYRSRRDKVSPIIRTRIAARRGRAML